MQRSRVVRTGTGNKNTSWTAELLEDLPQGSRPTPFIEIEHNFPTLEAACEWLGHPTVKINNQHGDAWER